MDQYRLVAPEHLNHYGYLFGGRLLQWVDEIAWTVATLDHPGCRFVTIGMDRVEFRKSVKQGSLLRFHSEKVRTGSTSVQYAVTVWNHHMDSGVDEKVFTTTIAFVALDDQGNKAAIPPPEV